MDKFTNQISDCPALSGWEKSSEHAGRSGGMNLAGPAEKPVRLKKTREISQKSEKTKASLT